MMADPAPLSRDDAIPLYHQIFLALRDRILAGELPFGAAVPTEHELCERHGVSRITARRALDELAAHDLVERRRRTGTHVIFRAPAAPIEADIEHAVEALIAFGRKTRVEVLAFDRQAAPPDIARALGLPGDGGALRARRLRYLDGEPLGVVDSYLAPAFAAGMTRAGLATTPLLQMLREAGHVPGSARQTVAAVAADPALSTLLHIEPRAPVVRIERVVTRADGVPMLFTIAQYRGDRYRLTIDLHG